MAQVCHIPRLFSAVRAVNSKFATAVLSVRNFHTPTAEPETQYHKIFDAKSGKTRHIAYKKIEGPRSPGIIYIPGFMADKSGKKAVALHDFCQKYGFPYVRYDPTGLGETKGATKIDSRYTLWMEDAKRMLLYCTDGPQLVVSSSMGCWIMSHVFKEHPEKVSGILMCAPAINFGKRYLMVLRSQLDEKNLKRLEEGDVVKLYNPDYGTFPMCKDMFEDMIPYELIMDPGKVPITCPVRIIHGIKDKDVPYQESLQLLKALQSTDVQLTYIKDAGHTLSDEGSLEAIYDTILKMSAFKPSD